MYFVRIFMRCDGTDTLIPGTSVEEIEFQVETVMTPTLLTIFGLILVDRVDITQLTPPLQLEKDTDDDTDEEAGSLE